MEGVCGFRVCLCKGKACLFAGGIVTKKITESLYHDCKLKLCTITPVQRIRSNSSPAKADELCIEKLITHTLLVNVC